MAGSGTASAPIVAIVGSTASGKTRLAVDVALALGGEIVNADAFQLYRGMDVGTAKPGAAERRRVPHHLLDVLDVSQQATVAAYQRAAVRVIDDIERRGRRPLLVGGSGLYVRAVLDGLDIPPTDPAVRGRLEAELERAGAPAMHARLAAVDPGAAAAILPSNGRRIVRALEVVELTGRPFPASLPDGGYARPAVQVGLAVPRDVPDRRIAERVERMWATGFVDEVVALKGAGLQTSRTASRALGYAQVLRMLDGEVTPEQAKAETVQATRRFARRQESWFRRDRRIGWLPYDAPDLVQRVIDHAAGRCDAAPTLSP